MKTELRGNCQCCGRVQAVLGTGRMSKHGYTVENGWFSGVCSGHNHRPLQEDRSVLDSTVEEVRRQMLALAKKLEAFKSGMETPNVVSNGRPGRYSQLIDWSSATLQQRELGLRLAISQMEGRIRAGAFYINDMLNLADTIHGTPLLNVPSLKVEGIKVGDYVKVSGREVQVTKIEFATVQGVGPSLNGQYIEHVYWEQNGRVMKYPKRLARRVKQQESA